MRRRMSRRWSGVALAAIIAASLAGCVGIPTSSSVTVGQNLVDRESDDIEFRPDAPVEGASQDEILRGFVAAFTGSAKDYSVARQFLSRGFASEWDPYSNVVVRTGAEELSTVDADTMEYSISAAAAVDETGAYRQNNNPVPLSLQFEFVEEGGEWRISAAADGIVLSSDQFRSIFGQHALYYLDPTSEHLVPDLRWFPGGTAPLRIVSALLAGPPGWLRGAVRTAFPEGTRLVAPSVEVQSGDAIVDLSPEALAASASERQLMQVQLTASLANVPSIRRVSISVNDAPLSIPEPGSSLPRPDPQVDSRALVMKDEEFGYLSSGTVTPIAGLSAKIVATNAVGATAASTLDAAAVLGSGMSIVQSGATESTLLDTRADLVAPSLDEYGYVWVASRSDASTIRAYTYSGVPQDISTGLPPGSEIVSLDVSRDGARIAILVSTAGGPRIVVTAINRDANAGQVPIGLSDPVLDASTGIGTALDATWVDGLSVAMLSSSAGRSSAMLYVIGGERNSLGQPDAVAIVGGNGESGLRALSSSGTVLSRIGNSWTDTRVPVSFIATQR